MVAPAGRRRKLESAQPERPDPLDPSSTGGAVGLPPSRADLCVFVGRMPQQGSAQFGLFPRSGDVGPGGAAINLGSHCCATLTTLAFCRHVGAPDL